MISSDARAQLVDAAAQKIANQLGIGKVMAGHLAAAEAVVGVIIGTEGEPCPTCDGLGYYAGHEDGCRGECHKFNCPVQVRCDDCQWSGRLPGTPPLMADGVPVVLVAMNGEHVGGTYQGALWTNEQAHVGSGPVWRFPRFVRETETQT